jgi:hypothetical protein
MNDPSIRPVPQGCNDVALSQSNDLPPGTMLMMATVDPNWETPWAMERGEPVTFVSIAYLQALEEGPGAKGVGKVRKAMALLQSGMKADAVALKIGYRGDNARASLYNLLRRHGINPKTLRMK